MSNTKCNPAPTQIPKLTPVSVGPYLRTSIAGQFGTIPAVNPSSNLSNLTVIITGGNSGLGLEAGKQLATFPCVSRLILACRSLEKGEEARRVILQHRQQFQAGENSIRSGNGIDISVWALDMADLKSIRAFAERCDTDLERIDSLVLNAGVDLVEYQKADARNGGFEMTVMVNVVGTMVLAGLMVEVLRKKTSRRKSDPEQKGMMMPPRIAMVGSAVQFVAKYDVLLEAANSNEGILNWLSDEKRWKRNITEERYSLSKGILQMLVAQLAAIIDQGEKSDGKPPVVVNVAAPGYCRTPLFRDSMSFGHRLGLKLVGREAHVGARALVEAAVGDNGGRASHGGYMENGVIRRAHPWFATEQGQEIGAKIWEEVLQIAEKVKPGVVNTI